MPTLEPPEPSLEALARLIDGMGLDETPTVTNVRDLSNRQLIERYTHVQQQLKLRGELVAPTSEDGKRLHSEHGAYLVELHRRKIR